MGRPARSAGATGGALVLVAVMALFAAGLRAGAGGRGDAAAPVGGERRGGGNEAAPARRADAGGRVPGAAARHGPPGAAGDAPSPVPRVRNASPGDVAAALERAGRIRPLTSLLISQDGELLGERYFHGFSRSRVFNVKSVSKTVLSALVGIAIREGHLEGTDQPVAELLPEYFSRVEDPRKRRITVGDLLSMQAGLRTTSFGNYGAWVASSDWVRAAIRKPVVCPPGRCWEYSTGNYHLLSAVLTRATGMSTRAFARRKLLGPLGIPARPWDRGPEGYYLGGNNMAFTPPELLRFGEMYLAGGRWQGRQVVSPEWIRRSWRPRVVSPRNGNGYGLGWWSRRVAGERVHFAWGYGGQYLFVVPRLDLAVVATADPRLERGRRDADRAIFGLLRTGIIPAIRGPAATG